MKMKEKRPVWQENVTCYLCYSCLNYCPSKAVRIYSKIWMKSHTPERGGYPHPYATVEEIAEQKHVWPLLPPVRRSTVDETLDVGYASKINVVAAKVS
jgi:Fe-S-cluster-containing hydrogenase component 2